MTYAAAALDRVAHDAGGRHAGRDEAAGTPVVDAVRVGRGAVRFASADGRYDRTPDAHRADVPQEIEIDPWRVPGADEHVTPRSLQSDRSIARRLGCRDAVRLLHRRVLRDLEP